MTDLSPQNHTDDAGFLLLSAIATLSAAGMMAFESSRPLPVLGYVSLLPVTLLAAAVGWHLLQRIHHSGIGSIKLVRGGAGLVFQLFACGAILALPPIAIDLVMSFPADINLPIPQAFLFYPAIALVAEVAFHLLPLAILILVMPPRLRNRNLLVPVAFVEPLFQMLFGAGSTLQSALVFCNVSLVSATGLWLFLRYGFAAMMGLRVVFYLFWHILWGSVRLSLLF